MLLLMLKQHLMPGEIGQMRLIQWLTNMSKLKKLELKKGQILYKRDYTHYMAVRLGSSDKMNEYKKTKEFGHINNLKLATILL